MFHRVLLGNLVAVGAAAFLLVPVATAMAGDPNAGDVWVDNVGQPAGPGREMDPHLTCQDINLGGAGLADSSGRYTIDGWAPSGMQERDYASSWRYDRSARGRQVLDVISVNTLIANAVANGDTPQPSQGFHFKLEFSQDPQKHKTFWVECPIPASATPPATPGGPPTSGGRGTPNSGQPPVASATRQSISSAITIFRCRRGMVKVIKRLHGNKVVACVARKKRHRQRTRRHAVVRTRRDPVFTG